MQRIFHRFGLVAMTVMAGVMVSSSPGNAAPQVLALVATQGATALICDGGACSAEFTAFCLQQDRNSPARGTTYRLEDTATVAVTGVTQDGRKIALDPEKTLNFNSLRTHVAVRISVDPATMARHGLKSVSVDVGEKVTLSPVPQAGDSNPQDAAGVAAAAGPLRAVGSRIVDSNKNRMAAARLTSRLINDLDANALPQGDVVQSLWKRAVGENMQASATAQGMARGALGLCQFAVEMRGISDIKGCLQQHHDRFVDFLNANYWKAVGAGS